MCRNEFVALLCTVVYSYFNKISVAPFHILFYFTYSYAVACKKLHQTKFLLHCLAFFAAKIN